MVTRAKYYSEVELDEEREVTVRFSNREAIDALDQNRVRLEGNRTDLNGR